MKYTFSSPMYIDKIQLAASGSEAVNWRYKVYGYENRKSCLIGDDIRLFPDGAI